MSSDVMCLRMTNVMQTSHTNTVPIYKNAAQITVQLSYQLWINGHNHHKARKQPESHRPASKPKLKAVRYIVHVKILILLSSEGRFVDYNFSDLASPLLTKKSDKITSPPSVTTV